MKPSRALFGRLRCVLPLLGLAFPAILSAATDYALVNFGDFELTRAKCTDASVSLIGAGTHRVLEVRTGHAADWPGVTLSAPAAETWDLSAYAMVTVALTNAGTNALNLFCRVDNSGANGTEHCVTASVRLGSGQGQMLRVPLKRASDDQLGGKLFGMRGYPVKIGGPGTVDPAAITQVLLFVSKPSEAHKFQVGTVVASGEYTRPTASTADADPFFPFIDTFGQYRHKNWPGKVNSLSDLGEKREAEAQELARQPGPAGWDRYGGSLAGPKRAATGFFHTEKVNGKWWFIDPEGRLFFSQGIDCVRMLDTTPIDERETWFEDFPGSQPQFAAFLTTGRALKGHYAGRSPRCFSFAAANLLRKYGPDWRAECPRLIHQRLRSWGSNTIGNWSDEAIRLMRLTPYCDAIGSGRCKMIEGSEGYWGKFPDVFDASFKEAVRQSMNSKRATSAGDRWCIGFFSDNEMSWGDEVSISLGALRSPATQRAKQVFVQDLKTKYGTIAKLNQAWGSKHESWEALLENREAPNKEKARGDLAAFYTRAAEEYFRTMRQAIKAVAPNQLYLGCRFAWVNPRAAAAAAEFCDVVSYNLYRRSVADFEFNGGADVPLIIGEFHFGALDRGMFHTGLVPVANQEERARAYKQYVLGALHHPQFVGCHWFQYQDEPVTGRVYDEENYQIGFVDVADTPYTEMIQASREAAAVLYSAP
jgi:hypothetical protein